MNEINAPFIGARWFIAIAFVFGLVATKPKAAHAWPATKASPANPYLAAASHGPIAQDDDDSDDKDVPTSQVDKYISVYESMQKDHNLTVDQAASKQGLTVAQFRDLENKIEADDTLRERVRKALRHAANPNEKESSDD